MNHGIQDPGSRYHQSMQTAVCLTFYGMNLENIYMTSDANGFRRLMSAALLLGALAPPVAATPAGQYRLHMEEDMLTAGADEADFSGLVDEQFDLGDPPSGQPARGWMIHPRHNGSFPFDVIVDLGRTTPLATLWIFDTNGVGDLKIETGAPGDWSEAAVYDCSLYRSWEAIPLDRESRYLRLTLLDPEAHVAEIALDAYSPDSWQAVLARRAEAARLEAERLAATRRAREEALKRPLVKLAPYGTLSLVDEVDLGAEDPGHMLRLDGDHRPELTTLLGRRCRVLPRTEGESTHLTVRLGAMKLLRPGAAYVLAVEYPEDTARSMVVINTGNETSRGFHTGKALGDAMHAKYVNNFVESLDVPLSGSWETWSLLFHLHDRFPERGLVRGSQTPRVLKPEDGFDVTIAQFSAKNIPISGGAAVARIRLYEVVDVDALAMPLNLPPDDLPRRRIFWREEMADGVIGGTKPEDRGMDHALDWYRHKAELMQFLGINTFSKDLLEFGACQHWDSGPYGGNDWVYHAAEVKHLWGEIVALMGTYGFDVFPYYEYSGSKGANGLGSQRRAKPLTRDDAYTHISWIESANADITDPDTLADFQKMLDLTVINLRDKARFAGIWIRPRSQMPVGFGPGTRERFTLETHRTRRVTRSDLRQDPALYEDYLAWWQVKRRDFFVRVRDYLRDNGIEGAVVLYSGAPGEPGVGFGDWDPRFVTDSPNTWLPILAQEAHAPSNGRTWQTMTPGQIVHRGDYLQGLTAPGLNWGDWEVEHARPADDPLTYKGVDGVLLGHAFNRLYTVSDPRTLDLFRGPSGLALVRHYALNEDMMFDRNGQPKLGYFVADIERAGPACMQAEAVAIAQGDPTMFGYLSGGNFGRGFPRYVRDFNANFLALPALPSRRLDGATREPDVVVRRIDTDGHGTYFSVVNVGMTSHRDVKVRLPGITGRVTALATGEIVPAPDGILTLELRPYQLVSLQHLARDPQP